MSPNLTAALLAERARRVTTIDIPEIDATVSIRTATAKEGFDYTARNAALFEDPDVVTIDQRMALMEDMCMALVVDPERDYAPVFSGDNRPSALLPVEGFTALVLGVLRAAGLAPKVEVAEETVGVPEASFGPLVLVAPTPGAESTPGAPLDHSTTGETNANGQTAATATETGATATAPVTAASSDLDLDPGPDPALDQDPTPAPTPVSASPNITDSFIVSPLN